VKSVAPLVSVVVANYRQSQFLPQAIDSAMGQGVDVELIVLDDASGDGSRGVIERLAREHEAIKPIFNEQNLGISRTHNLGLDAAQGDFIAFLPADDYWYPGKLASQLRLLEEESRLVGAYADSDVVDVDGKPTGQSWSTLHPAPPGVDEANLASRLLHGMFVSGNTGLYRRSVAGDLRFDERLSFYNDWLFWIMLALRGPVRGELQARAAYRTSASTFRRPPLIQAEDQVRLLEILSPLESRFDASDFDRLVAGAVLGLTMKGESVRAFQQLVRARPAVRRKLLNSRFFLRWLVSWMRVRENTLLSCWNANAAPR